MAKENGYANQKSYELYDTSGATEDWTYYATGGLGFTFEIGLTAFHDTFADGVVAERVTNFAAAEPYDGTVTFNKTEKSEIKIGLEKWTLVCREKKGGPVKAVEKVLVKRGGVANVNLASACD